MEGYARVERYMNLGTAVMWVCGRRGDLDRDNYQIEYIRLLGPLNCNDVQWMLARLGMGGLG